MRVLFWSEMFWPYIGGAEIMATQLLLALQRRGHEFVVVTSHGWLDLPDEATYNGIPVHRFPFQQALAAGNIDQLVAARQQVAQLRQAFAPALTHISHVGPSALFHLQTMAAHPSPALVTMQQQVLPRQSAGSHTLLERILRSADWVTAVSAAALAQTCELVPQTLSRSSLIYNSVDVPRLLPAPLPFDPPRLLCLGRLVPAKGFDLALRAFAPVVERFPRSRLVIAGDGPQRPVLERQARALHLSRAVDFLGWVAPEQVPALLNTATVVVMPSRIEGLPLVAVQAALMARPIVATRAGGLPEIVAHDETGLLVEADDSGALSTAICGLLDHPATARQMGREGRERARALFNWEHSVDAYDALYRQLGG